MPVQRYTRKIIRYTAVIVTVWNLNGSVLALFFYRIKILMTQIRNKLLYPPVQSFNPFAERTRNPLEFIMSKSMGWFLHSWNEKYAYFFCFVFLKISVHIVIPRLKGNKPYSIFCGINFHALFHVICKIYKFLGIFPIVIFYCFSLIFSV